MAVLRSTSFFNAQIVGPGPVDLYTVPAGHVIILKNILMYNHANTSNAATVALASGPTYLSRVLLAAGNAAAELITTMWVVVNAGEKFQGYSDTGKHLTIALSGSLLYI